MNTGPEQVTVLDRAVRTALQGRRYWSRELSYTKELSRYQRKQFSTNRRASAKACGQNKLPHLRKIKGLWGEMHSRSESEVVFRS